MAKIIIPKYRLHKPSAHAVVTLNGKDHYLGKHNTNASRQRYHRLLAEWEANGQRTPDDINQQAELTVSQIILPYWRWARKRYRRPDGTGTSTIDNVRMAMRMLRRLYGRVPVSKFGPVALQTCRQQMIKKKWKRSTVNKSVGRVQSMFKWAVAQQLIPVEIYQSLATVGGLRRGEEGVIDGEPVRPVPEAQIKAVKLRVSRQVRALVELQRLTGARPTELLNLRPVDLDTAGAIWIATLKDHKTAHHGQSRVLHFGPQAQKLLQQFLANRTVHAYLFNPREAIKERAEEAAAHRRPDQKSNPRKTNRTIAERYNVGSYRRAIHRACDAASIPRWSPNRLRHNAATVIRREFGIEAAQVVLGHTTPDTTVIYAERNLSRGCPRRLFCSCEFPQ